MLKKMDKMWLLYGLTLVTFLTIVNCTDPELSMEAAFQGELIKIKTHLLWTLNTKKKIKLKSEIEIKALIDFFKASKPA